MRLITSSRRRAVSSLLYGSRPAVRWLIRGGPPMTEAKRSRDSIIIKVSRSPLEARIHNLLPADHPTYALIKLDVMIWKMAKVNIKTGSCITGQLNGHYPRFNAIIALGALRGLSTNLLKEIETIQHSTSNLAKERNRIVHDAWFLETATGHVSQFRSVLPKRQTSGFEDINESAVYDLISRITRRVDEISRLWTKIANELQPLS